MAWSRANPNTPPTAVEIFAGGGLMSLALDIEGVVAQHHCELDVSAAATIRNNIDPNAVSCDVRAYHPKPTPGGLDILVGGPPCQPWSQGGVQKGKDDPRNLWPEVLRLIDEARPRVVLMENVHGILHKKHQPYLEWWWGEAATLGYTGVLWKVLGADYGSPQRRGRVWFVLYPEGAPWGSRLQQPPPSTHVDPRKIASGESNLLPWVRAFDQLNDGCCGGFGYYSCVNLGNRWGLCGGCVSGSNYETAPNDSGDEELSENALKYLKSQESMAKHPPVDTGGVFAWDELKKGVRRTTGTYLAPTVPKGKERSEHFYFGTREGVVGPGELSCPIDEWMPVLRQLTVRDIAKLQSVPQWYRFHAESGLSEEQRQRAMKAQVGNGIDVNMGRAVGRYVLAALGYAVPFPGSQAEEQSWADECIEPDAPPQGLWPLYQIGMCPNHVEVRLTPAQIQRILEPFPKEPPAMTNDELALYLTKTSEVLRRLGRDVQRGDDKLVPKAAGVLKAIAAQLESYVPASAAPAPAQGPWTHWGKTQAEFLKIALERYRESGATSLEEFMLIEAPLKVGGQAGAYSLALIKMLEGHVPATASRDPRLATGKVFVDSSVPPGPGVRSPIHGMPYTDWLVQFAPFGLTEDEMVVLAKTKRLKSSYRRKEAAEHGVDKARYDAALASLVAKGFLGDQLGHQARPYASVSIANRAINNEGRKKLASLIEANVFPQSGLSYLFRAQPPATEAITASYGTTEDELEEWMLTVPLDGEVGVTTVCGPSGEFHGERMCSLMIEVDDDNDAYYLLSGPTGTQRLSAEPDITDGARLWAHWTGFVDNNREFSAKQGQLFPGAVPPLNIHGERTYATRWRFLDAMVKASTQEGIPAGEGIVIGTDPEDLLFEYQSPGKPTRTGGRLIDVGGGRYNVWMGNDDLGTYDDPVEAAIIVSGHGSALHRLVGAQLAVPAPAAPAPARVNPVDAFRNLMVAGSYGAFTTPGRTGEPTSPGKRTNTFTYLGKRVTIRHDEDGTFLVFVRFPSETRSSDGAGSIGHFHFSDAAAAIQAVQQAVAPAPAAPAGTHPDSTKEWYVWAEDASGDWLQFEGPYRRGHADKVFTAIAEAEAGSGDPIYPVKVTEKELRSRLEAMQPATIQKMLRRLSPEAASRAQQAMGAPAIVAHPRVVLSTLEKGDTVEVTDSKGKRQQRVVATDYDPNNKSVTLEATYQGKRRSGATAGGMIKDYGEQSGVLWQPTMSTQVRRVKVLKWLSGPAKPAAPAVPAPAQIDYANLDNWESVRRGDGLDVLRSENGVFEIRRVPLDALLDTWVYDLYYQPLGSAGALEFYDGYESALEASEAADQFAEGRAEAKSYPLAAPAAEKPVGVEELLSRRAERELAEETLEAIIEAPTVAAAAEAAEAYSGVVPLSETLVLEGIGTARSAWGTDDERGNALRVWAERKKNSPETRLVTERKWKGRWAKPKKSTYDDFGTIAIGPRIDAQTGGGVYYVSARHPEEIHIRRVGARGAPGESYKQGTSYYKTEPKTPGYDAAAALLGWDLARTDAWAARYGAAKGKADTREAKRKAEYDADKAAQAAGTWVSSLHPLPTVAMIRSMRVGEKTQVAGPVFDRLATVTKKARSRWYLSVWQRDPDGIFLRSPTGPINIMQLGKPSKTSVSADSPEEVHELLSMFRDSADGSFTPKTVTRGSNHSQRPPRYHAGDEVIYEGEVVIFLRYLHSVGEDWEMAAIELPDGGILEVWLDELE